MKNRTGTRLALTGMASALVLAWHPPARSAAADGTGAAIAQDAPPVGAATLRQVRRSMLLDLHGSAAEAFPLFGPVREAEWATGWQPRFAAPFPPSQGADGAVFTTEGHGGESVWVMTAYDSAAGRIAYVVVTPRLVTCELEIHVSPAGDSASRAEVTFRYTALEAEGNVYIEHWLGSFVGMAPHWEHALDARLLALHPGPGR